MDPRSMAERTHLSHMIKQALNKKVPLKTNHRTRANMYALPMLEPNDTFYKQFKHFSLNTNQHITFEWNLNPQ